MRAKELEGAFERIREEYVQGKYIVYLWFSLPDQDSAVYVVNSQSLPDLLAPISNYIRELLSLREGIIIQREGIIEQLDASLTSTPSPQLSYSSLE